MRSPFLRHGVLALSLVMSWSLAGCSDESSGTGENAGGQAGQPSAGTAGQSGQAGGSSGTAGQSGAGGSSGQSGAGGSSGQGGAGQAGQGGAAGLSGSSGQSGEAGQGPGGSDSGAAGAAGQAGEAGAGPAGSAGQGGAGEAGQGGAGEAGQGGAGEAGQGGAGEAGQGGAGLAGQGGAGGGSAGTSAGGASGSSGQAAGGAAGQGGSGGTAAGGGAGQGGAGGGGGLPFTAVRLVSGERHTCAVLTGGVLKCWGENVWGQLGQGDTDQRGDNAGEMGDKLPAISLGTGLKVVSVAGGYTHTCALFEDGRVKCWGKSDVGQLGLGDTVTRGDKPNQMGDKLPFVDLGTGLKAVALSSRGDHTCALFDGGKIKCWGRNFTYQLGQDGNTNNRGDAPGEMGDNLPFVDLGVDIKATAVATGQDHTCALLESGKIKCWGDNNNAALGGSSFFTVGKPEQMGDNLPTVNTGVASPIVQVTLGDATTCVVFASGQSKCWGKNAYGQLGLGDKTLRGFSNDMGGKLPFVDLGTGAVATQMSAGSFSTCALLDGGRVKCWGYNLAGQLGQGDTSNRGDNPDEMGDKLPAINLGTSLKASAVATGRGHVCALLEEGTVKCWGNNSDGQLGLGDVTSRGDKPNQMGDALPTVGLAGVVAP